MEYLDFINNLLKESSIVANKNFGKVIGRTKPDDSTQVLTDTDLEIGKYIIGEIKRKYPNYNIIDEESGVFDQGSNFTWVIDPIDGTSNFAVGVPTYGIMIGLLENDIPIVGGFCLPTFDQIFLGQKEKGATLNKEKIQVSSEKDLSQVLVAYGIDPHRGNPDKIRSQLKVAAELVLNSRNLRASNSVFDIAMLAKGSYGGYISLSGKIWDSVSPHIVIEEAGGIYTDYFGKLPDYTNPLSKTKINFTACAASSTLHEKLQKIIHEDDQF